MSVKYSYVNDSWHLVPLKEQERPIPSCLLAQTWLDISPAQQLIWTQTEIRVLLTIAPG